MKHLFRKLFFYYYGMRISEAIFYCYGIPISKGKIIFCCYKTLTGSYFLLLWNAYSGRQNYFLLLWNPYPGNYFLLLWNSYSISYFFTVVEHLFWKANQYFIVIEHLFRKLLFTVVEHLFQNGII